MGKYVWQITEKPQGLVEKLIKTTGFSRPIALYLASRGVDPDLADNFLNCPLKGLSDPYAIPGIEKASARLWDAILKREKILIHGDYDADGITSAALLYWTLTKNGADAAVFIPHRFEDGYGFTSETLEKAHMGTGCRLIVTVDCGINSMDAAASARQKGIDIIITDHHEPQKEIPDVFVVVNPKLSPRMDSLEILSGVGVTFKLCHGFVKYGRQRKLGAERFDLREGLDLVALGTVADIVPLTGENRILVRNGLKMLSKQIRPGIRALCETSGLNLSASIKSSEITYSLAPRINAAGRLGDPYTALDLLTTSSITEAYHFAEKLNKYNKIRQEKEDGILNEALAKIGSSEKYKDMKALLIAGESWHQGVIGIVASRLSKVYNKAVIVFSINGDQTLGSCRSITGLNIIEALTECSHVLDRFGGHPMAAGLALKTSNLEEFFSTFESVICRKLKEGSQYPMLDIDGEIELSELDDEFYEVLGNLEPFGHSNQQPHFLMNRLTPVKVNPVANNHTRGMLKDAKNNTIPFIAFNRSVDSFPATDSWNVVAIPTINSYNGNETRQLQLVDVS